jgi:alkylhydroperoxidase family enzyme
LLFDKQRRCIIGHVKISREQEMRFAPDERTSMDQKTLPRPRLAPLPPGHTPELKEMFADYAKRGSYIPNSMLIMQRKPKLALTLTAFHSAIFDPEGEVDPGFKRLLAFVCSRSAGCQYCMAHQVGGSFKLGVSEDKFDAIWDYQTSPLYTPGERAALDVAVAAGCVPNAVTDEMFNEMKKYWNEGQIVEIVATISIFGFFNRWNDTMATPLEEIPVEKGNEHLAPRGWNVGKHASR